MRSNYAQNKIVRLDGLGKRNNTYAAKLVVFVRIIIVIGVNGLNSVFTIVRIVTTTFLFADEAELIVIHRINILTFLLLSCFVCLRFSIFVIVVVIIIIVIVVRIIILVAVIVLIEVGLLMSLSLDSFGDELVQRRDLAN